MKTVSIALFAGMVCCGFVESAPAAESAKFTEKVIYSFCSQQNCSDGYRPLAGVIDVKGTLFGTTTYGGNDNGTVFSLDPDTGAEAVIHSFDGHRGGSLPYAGLIDVKGKLYGTTSDEIHGMRQECGSKCGTVFSISRNTGAEKVLHSFVGGADGEYPEAGLIDVGGMLYGTTIYGGGTGCYGGGCGTVFSLDPSTGAEQVLYSFTGGTDGAEPLIFGNLIAVNGVLYGTTFDGGGTRCQGSGCGTVFSLDPGTAAETVLYSFAGGTDGAMPEAGLIDVGGTLYGTTYVGGPSGGGTVFSINPGTGAHAVLYSFCSRQNCTDGRTPTAGLIDVDGILYGTTAYGDVPGGLNGLGCGNVFSVDPNTGAEKVLYSFAGGTNGANPFAGLTDVKGTLYGTTYAGGTGDRYHCQYGCGTVFALTKNR